MSDEELLSSSPTDDVIVPSSIPSPSTFSNNIIEKLGLRGRRTQEAETALTNNNNATEHDDEARPSTSGIVSPLELALKSIDDNLVTPLRPILKSKVRAASKCEFLRNCVVRNFIPKGVLPKVPIKIENPATTLKEKWDATLKECGNKLLRALIDFHRGQISELEELAQDTIMKGSHIIIPEFVANISDITERIEDAIDNLQCETSLTGKRFKNRQKRKLEAPTNPTPERPSTTAQKNSNSISSKEGQQRKRPRRPLKVKKRK